MIALRLGGDDSGQRWISSTPSSLCDLTRGGAGEAAAEPAADGLGVDLGLVGEFLDLEAGAVKRSRSRRWPIWSACLGGDFAAGALIRPFPSGNVRRKVRERPWTSPQASRSAVDTSRTGRPDVWAHGHAHHPSPPLRELLLGLDSEVLPNFLAFRRHRGRPSARRRRRRRSCLGSPALTCTHSRGGGLPDRPIGERYVRFRAEAIETGSPRKRPPLRGERDEHATAGPFVAVRLTRQAGGRIGGSDPKWFHRPMQALIVLALFATPKEAVVLAALAGCLVVALAIHRTIHPAPRHRAPHTVRPGRTAICSPPPTGRPPVSATAPTSG